MSEVKLESVKGGTQMTFVVSAGDVEQKVQVSLDCNLPSGLASKLKEKGFVDTASKERILRGLVPKLAK
jgi:hypothetical protein